MKIAIFLPLFLISFSSLTPTTGAKMRGLARGNPEHRLLEGDDKDDKDDKDDEDDGNSSGGDLVAAACFPEDATVIVKGTGRVSMKDLQVGDQVLTETSYQPVYAFGHLKPAQQAEFLQFTSSNKMSKPVELTEDHLVFIHGKDHPVRAGSVKVGDILKAVAASDTSSHEVTTITKITRKGLYAPFTPGGTIVVNDVLASSYVSVQGKESDFVEVGGGMKIMSEHDWVHMGVSPMRLLCHRLSSKICEHYDEEGIPYYASFAIKVNQWSRRQHPVVHALLVFSVIVLTGACFLAEKAVDAFMLHGTLLVMVAAFAWAKACRIHIQAGKAKKVD